MSSIRVSDRKLPHRAVISVGAGREAGRRWMLRRGGRVLGGLGLTLCVGLASCMVTVPVRPPPRARPCVEPIEVVDQVDRGWALLVGRDEADVRLVPAGTLVEGMALSGGRPSAACGAWLRERMAATRQGVRRAFD